MRVFIFFWLLVKTKTKYSLENEYDPSKFVLSKNKEIIRIICLKIDSQHFVIKRHTLSQGVQNLASMNVLL